MSSAKVVIKYSLILFLLLKAVCAFSQSTKQVVDKETNRPIAYATIKILGKPLGVIASDKGEFQLAIDPPDSVMISCVGYEQVILSGSNMGPVIYLDPKIKVLNEITVRERKWIKTILLGNGVEYLNTNFKCQVTSETDMATVDCLPWGPGEKTEFAERIELPSKDLVYKIKKLIIPVSKSSCWGSLLIHLYYEDSISHQPGEEFLIKQIDVNKKIITKNKAFVDMDMENLYLYNSKTFFMGISWLEGASKQKCMTRVSIIRSGKTNTYVRSLHNNNYDWGQFGGVKKGDPLSTIFAVELDEMK